MARQVKTLCKCRDQILMKSKAGRKFVKFYYRISPPVARFIKDRPVLKSIVRMGLKPLIWFSKKITE